jgi:hypothetical protein
VFWVCHVVAIIISEPALPSLTFFGDASSKGHDYMVAGGFAVSAHRIQEINDFIDALRESAGIGEFHWSKYRGGDQRETYQQVVAMVSSL